jgi:hypothetical protein
VALLPIIERALRRRPSTCHRRSNDEVTDVVSYALLACDSQHSDFSTKGIHAPPRLQGDASFVPPTMMAFTMPANIIFLGKTTNQIRIAGREKDGKVSAEIDGQPLTRNW